ncbi:MAG: Crp/Fnr family transcriptional regulator, partial [Pontixanthobacter sp.]
MGEEADNNASDAELARYPNTARFLAGRLRTEMSDAEKAQLEGLIVQTDWIDGPKRLLESGKTYEHSTMLIEGFLLRTLEVGDKRYAVSFHVPGDFVDLHCFALKRLDHNIDTIGRVKIGYVPHAALAKVMETSPHLTRILWFSTLLDAAMHR